MGVTSRAFSASPGKRVPSSCPTPTCSLLFSPSPFPLRDIGRRPPSPPEWTPGTHALGCAHAHAKARGFASIAAAGSREHSCGGGARPGRGGRCQPSSHVPRRGVVLSPPAPRRPGGFQDFRWNPSEGWGDTKSLLRRGYVGMQPARGSPGTWELMPGQMGCFRRVPVLDPLMFADTFISSPLPNTHNSGVRGCGERAHSFILRAAESQAQDPEKRQEDGEGVGAGTRLKSARRPARGEGCGPSCRELSAARRCSRDTSPRRSKRAEICSSLRGDHSDASAPPYSSQVPSPFPPPSTYLTSGNCCRRLATSRPSIVGSWRFSSFRRVSSTGAQ